MIYVVSTLQFQPCLNLVKETMKYKLLDINTLKIKLQMKIMRIAEGFLYYLDRITSCSVQGVKFIRRIAKLNFNHLQF